MENVDPQPDALTRATVAIAWIIVGNKPLYPVYVWWLVGNGVAASCGSMLSAPLFLAIALIARRAPFVARLMMPVVGTLDTLFETKLFGAASGTELFLAPCMMLASLSFRASEVWWQRGVIVFVFATFVFSRTFVRSPLHFWNPADLSVLFNLNAFAVASLAAFIALRYAATRS